MLPQAQLSVIDQRKGTHTYPCCRCGSSHSVGRNIVRPCGGCCRAYIFHHSIVWCVRSRLCVVVQAQVLEFCVKGMVSIDLNFLFDNVACPPHLADFPGCLCGRVVIKIHVSRLSHSFRIYALLSAIIIPFVAEFEVEVDDTYNDFKLQLHVCG